VAASSESNSSQTEGERLRVVGTDGEGVNLRTAPSVSARLIKTLPEGLVVQAQGDPRQNEGRTWRNVREPEGASGWLAAEFVVPV
jgi:SH3-like domain-containing protein